MRRNGVDGPGSSVAGPTVTATGHVGSATQSQAEVWLCEIKFDGYRMLVRVAHGKARFFTRNGHDWTSRLRSLQQAIEDLQWPPGWFDGEIVVPNDGGIPDFGALQQAFDTGHTDEVLLYLFDLPYFDGHDLRGLPLDRRRALLQGLLLYAPSDRVRFSEAFDAAPDGIFASACKLGLEGIIVKRRSAPYQSSRSVDWLKLKCGLRQEFVIGGYTGPQGTRSGFGSLLLGFHDAHGAPQYASKVGSGFSQRALTALMPTHAALARSSSPFSGHAQLEGLRARFTKAQLAKITNPRRLIDPSTGITRIDLVRYYGLVGRLMMKHLKARPVSLVRAPDGVDGPLFFQKHAETDKLPGIR